MQCVEYKIQRCNLLGTARERENLVGARSHECFVDLSSIESHNDRAVNDNHRSGHVAKLLEICQCSRILNYVSFLKLYGFLREILFRLVTEHSPRLGINDDFLHFSPASECVLPVINGSIASLTAAMTWKTGWPA